MAIALERSDMKKFNRYYTTPEQSMRLLKLGLQPNSANLFYSKFERETFGQPKLCYEKRYCDIVPHGYEEYYLPCWSVGRLIEIYLICNEVVCGVTELHHSAVKIDVREFTIVDYIIRKIENKIKKKGESFLSKLEE